jgi:hypothetical protein
MSFEFAKILTKLGEAVVCDADLESGEDGFADLAGTRELDARWSRTSMMRSRRVSWILMPGILVFPEGMAEPDAGTGETQHGHRELGPGI